MKEFRTIVSEYDKIDFQHRRAVLATVVKVQGSSYRSPGARMLITDDGKWVGSISGGCLEGDALRKARQVMTDQKPMTVTYDTREESNQNLGIGLGCNGVIHVLLEPLLPNNENIVSLFKRFVDTKAPLALATIFNHPSAVGEKILVDARGTIIEQFKDEKFAHRVKTDLMDVFDTRKSTSVRYDDEFAAEVFIELIQPSLSLVIFGGGFDARPVSQLARALGWEVHITDECVAHLAPLFFPDTKLSLCHRSHLGEAVNITPYTACVLMSHNYEYDRDVLRKLLTSESPYIGILGPRKRFDKMLKEFEQEGICPTADDFHRIHSPIGLDIGAETPDEIAVAIVGEIQSKMTNRSGGFLKYRSGPIHQRDVIGDQVFKQVYIAPSDRSATA